MSKTKIEWSEETWNPTSGCSRTSEGCFHCYAEKLTKRLAAMGLEKYQGLLNEHGRFNGVLKLDETALLKPLQTKKPTTYFVNSMSDLFHENIKDEWIDKVFAVMALCPQHTFQILTKRAEQMRDYFSVEKSVLANRWMEVSYDFHLTRKAMDDDIDAVPCDVHNWTEEYFPFPNVHLGVSVENQKHKTRIDLLRETPSAYRFISFEPLLEDLGEINLRGINQAIFGGESGGGARPCHLEWIINGVKQCREQSVAPFVKQAGSNPYYQNKPLKLKSRKGNDLSELPEELRVREI